MKEKLQIISEEWEHSQRERNPAIAQACRLSALRMMVQLGKDAQTELNETTIPKHTPRPTLNMAEKL
jgi:hypothetical protein